MSQFTFLQREWPEVFDSATRAEEAVFSKAQVIDTLGNRAVHSHRPMPEAVRATTSAA